MKRDEARRVEVQYRVSARGALCLSSSLFKPLQRRHTLNISNREICPCYVGGIHCCKAPLWGRHLDLVSLNPIPRFAVSSKSSEDSDSDEIFGTTVLRTDSSQSFDSGNDERSSNGSGDEEGPYC